MNIDGLQKMTLLDYPGKIACTIFLSRCNLRCPFCHNASLVLPDKIAPPLMTDDFLLDFLKGRVRRLDGVCITGGEPTLHRELPGLIRKIRDLGFLVKLDTNGTNPEMLSSLLREGLLDYVAMDIKNSPLRYRETCGGADVFDQVSTSAKLLMDSPIDYEFRTTAAAPLHTPEDLEQIGIWLQGARQYFIQQFADSGDLVGNGIHALSPDDMSLLRQAVLPYIPNTHLRGLT